MSKISQARGDIVYAATTAVRITSASKMQTPRATLLASMS